MTGNAQIIQCSNCGAKNRVSPENQAGREPVCGRCKLPLSVQTHPITFTDKNFATEAEKSALPVLVDFWAVWCGPCRMVAPVIDQLAKDFAGKVRVGKLNVDENQMTATRFRVQSIPTLLILKDGREVDRIVGAQSKEGIAQRLKPFI